MIFKMFILLTLLFTTINSSNIKEELEYLQIVTANKNIGHIEDGIMRIEKSILLDFYNSKSKDVYLQLAESYILLEKYDEAYFSIVRYNKLSIGEKSTRAKIMYNDIRPFLDTLSSFSSLKVESTNPLEDVLVKMIKYNFGNKNLDNLLLENIHKFQSCCYSKNSIIERWLISKKLNFTRDKIKLFCLSKSTKNEYFLFDDKSENKTLLEKWIKYYKKNDIDYNLNYLNAIFIK